MVYMISAKAKKKYVYPIISTIIFYILYMKKYLRRIYTKEVRG